MNAPESKSPLSVQPGMQVHVEILYDSGSEKMTFVIVPDEQADYGAGLLGEGTPLARTLLGQRVGSRIPYHQGDARWVRILSAAQAGDTPGEQVAARRRERLRRNLDQIDRANAIAFASSFSGKWGDYDPEGIEKWEQEDKEDGN